MQEETKTELWFSDYESDFWINCTHRGFFRFWQNLIEVDHRDFRDLNTSQLTSQKRAHIDCTVFRRADPRIRSARDQPFLPRAQAILPIVSRQTSQAVAKLHCANRDQWPKASYQTALDEDIAIQLVATAGQTSRRWPNERFVKRAIVLAGAARTGILRKR